MSLEANLEANKELIRRYLSAVDSNEAEDWDVLDDYIAEDSSPAMRRLPALRWTGPG